MSPSHGGACGRLPRVRVVAVTAQPAIRVGDGDLAARLSRSIPTRADCTIVNAGAPETAAAQFVAHLRSSV